MSKVTSQVTILGAEFAVYDCFVWLYIMTQFSALMLLVGWQEGHPACKKPSGWCWRGICLERGADLHMAQLMPLPLTVSCSSKIQIGFTFLVSAHQDSPGQRAVKRVCVRVCCINKYAKTVERLVCNAEPLKQICREHPRCHMDLDVWSYPRRSYTF